MTAPALVGHETVWARLMARLAGDRLPHALLFTGPPGVGKARLAHRLAARLACATGAAGPCGECNGCRQVAAGSHPDCVVIGFGTPARGRKAAGKKEIGIDHARELKRFVQLQAIAAARKIAIVDDADRLSIAAQNALLKTLEEPPGQALIVLITGSPGALLPTVRSRCQRINFGPLTTAQVRDLLLAAGVAADAAARLAEAADGSPGRALALHERWQDEAREEVARLLADLRRGRYGSVLAMSKGLGSTEQDTAARLDGLLALCHADATRAAADGDRPALRTAVQRAETVAEALVTLRRRNPNRTLLTEALALRLARG
ncbi:MAG: DNA polymerase III subunit delta' [Candidatus Binatia bacterium]